jgi:hypothetical protein
LQPLHICRCFNGYSIIYLNTVITSNDDEDRGKLVIGNNDLHLALQEAKSRNTNAPIIVLAHHAPECFSAEECHAVEKLLKEYSVKLYICGDSHGVWHRCINQTAEITMGCIKQEDGAQAAFAIGELSYDGSILINAHYWDTNLGGWGPYTQFDRTVKDTLPQRPFIKVDELNLISKDLYLTVEDRKIPLFGFVNYVDFLSRRKDYNNLKLTPLITYHIYEKSAQNISDAGIIYDFQGTNFTEFIQTEFVMYITTSILSAERNLPVRCTDVSTGEQLGIRMTNVADDELRRKVSIIYPHGRLYPGESFHFKFEISPWKNFYKWDGPDEILIDPMNYSVKTRRITVRFVSGEPEFISKRIYVYKCDRRNLHNKTQIYIGSAIKKYNDYYVLEYTMESEDDSLYLVIII